MCSYIKFFSLFCFHITLTKIYSFFQIPTKLISRQVHTLSLIPTHFNIKIAFLRNVYTQSYNQLVPQVDHPHCVDLSLSYIQGCRLSMNSSVLIHFLIGKVIFVFSTRPLITTLILSLWPNGYSI